MPNKYFLSQINTFKKQNTTCFKNNSSFKLNFKVKHAALKQTKQQRWLFSHRRRYIFKII